MDENIFLQHQLYSLIVSQLRDDSYFQAAAVVANATFTPVETGLPPNKLLELVRKGIAAEREAAARAGGRPGAPLSHADKDSAPLPGGGGGAPSGYGLPPPASATPDFSAPQGTKGAAQRKPFPKHDAKNISEHKNVARCARFSPNGRLLATGSTDTAVKLFEVEKVKQTVEPEGGHGQGGQQGSEQRPLLRTFFDHLQPVNDVDFHPHQGLLISASSDCTIKFFDFGKSSNKRAYRVIQDTHNVRSVAFHPCGDFLLAGTDHAVAHLYDVNTFQCYLSAQLQDAHYGGAINQVRYSTSGNMYVTASKDGSVRIWDGVSARCVRAITNAHSACEATSAAFTRDDKYILTCGKDSTARMWEVASGQQVKAYVGAQHTRTRSQAVLSHGEDFVLSVDELSNEIVVWDSLTAEIVHRLPSGHVAPSGQLAAPKWLEHSPAEDAFVTCGHDRAVRFWRGVSPEIEDRAAGTDRSEPQKTGRC